MVQYIVVNRHTGSHQLGNAPLHQLLGQLGVFQLFTDSHPFAGPYQFGQIGVERMVREAGQLDILCGAVCPAGKCNTQNFRCNDGIVRKSFIEIAHSEKQYGIGVLGLHLDVLFHQRGFNNFLGHDIFLSSCLRLFKRNKDNGFGRICEIKKM